MNMGSLSVVTTESSSPNFTNMRDTDTIIVRNCKTSGLGIKIVGGKSTVGGGDYGIFVKKILAGGRAEAEGHLREGDQLLEVNGDSMLGVSNDKAISLLRNAAETNNVKLLISRDAQAREEFTAMMTALNDNGFSTLNGPGVVDLFRSGSRGSSRASTPSPTMEKRSWVMSAGQMSPLAFGRHGSPNWSPSNSLDRPQPSLQRMQAVDLSSTGDLHKPGPVDPPPYQRSSGMFQLSLGPSSSRNGASNIPFPHPMNGDNSPPKVSPKNGGTELQSDSEVTIDSGLPTDRHSSTPSPNFDSPGELQVIRIPITTGLGLCIVGGTNRSEGPHIYVDNLIEGGDAQRDNQLQPGDQLVTINGETLVGVTHEQAKSLLTRLKLRKDITEIEIAFIRGGHSTLSRYSPPNPLVNGGSPGPSHYPEGNNQLESPPLSSRSSLDNGVDFSNTDTELNEMLQTSASGSSGEIHQSSVPGSSPFIPNGVPVYSSHPTPMTTNPPMPQAVSHIQSGHPLHFAQSVSLPPHTNNGFYPTMSSTPTSLMNGEVLNRPTLPMSYATQGQMNGFAPGAGVGPISSHQHHLANGSIQISPIAPTLQPSSVPFYLQQDLEVLRRVSEQYPSQQESPRNEVQRTTPEAAAQSSLSQRQRRNRIDRSTRKLSLDPYTKLKVEKLEVALRYLGFNPTEEQQRILRVRLPIDHNGCTTYGEFVNAARNVFAVKLNESHLNTSAFQFAIQDINAMERKMQLESQQATEAEAEAAAAAKQASEDIERLRRERDEAMREVQHLRKALKRKEQQCKESSEEVLKTRRETQALLEESRSLQNRIHLVSKAQEASKNVEQDYEEVIKLLENEVAELRLKNSQKTPDPKELEELQKRLVVLGCQLRKAEVSKRTYEVSTEKLIRFAELVHDVLSQNTPGMPQQRGRGEPARKDVSGNARPPSYLARHAKHNPTTLAKEAREVVKSVKALIEEEPLPFGWEEAYTPDGVRYYINHVTQQTSWLHPVTHVQHLPPIMENKEEQGVKETRT